MRLDKFIAEKLFITRSQASKLLKSKQITVNDVIINHNINISENDIIKYKGEEWNHGDEFVYLALNKPSGYVCANTDKINQTVFELLPPEISKIKNIHTVGRLDKDTTGLLLITNDGEFTHNLLAPKKHITKVYEVTLDKELKNELIDIFAQGFKIDNDEIVKPSKLELISNNKAILEITEGKYHQVKRMFSTYGYNVLNLHRSAFGNLQLNNLKLNAGEFTYIKPSDVKRITD
ncbi:pseudouridine synthase [Mycoplasma seminis]|uniref:Pseudouridine synthase n=1 Tax=Mycoplasma seminis TaxID=512749 RepID=A0ABY9HDI3_9MOLU|nr:16S rRNA pseudouridine(516) synthase [Mycoplasma seminis]WLP85743.1 16S rRNA pseudouridine(516) synthase [Mycoplasma seminis]